MMITHANPSEDMIGYIPDDASYPLRTFEVVHSQLKPGCAEAVVNGLLELAKSHAPAAAPHASAPACAAPAR